MHPVQAEYALEITPEIAQAVADVTAQISFSEEYVKGLGALKEHQDDTLPRNVIEFNTNVTQLPTETRTLIRKSLALHPHLDYTHPDALTPAQRDALLLPWQTLTDGIMRARTVAEEERRALAVKEAEDAARPWWVKIASRLLRVKR